MQLNGLLALLEQTPTFSGLLDLLNANRPTPDQHILRSARPYVIAALTKAIQRPLLIVTGSVERAYTITEQLPAWLPETPILRFAEPSSLFYDRSPWAPNTIRARLDVLGALCPPIGLSEQPTSTPPVIVASALALMQRTLPVREFKASSRVIKARQQADPDKLLRTWLGIGYQPASVVVEPGTFNRRGGIVDVFPINAPRPVRMEFWGDEVESLRGFDPQTQRSAETLDKMVIIPAREALPKLSRPVADRLSDWFAMLPPGEQDLTSAQPDESDLRSESAFSLIEFYLPYFYSQPVSLLDYLPDNALLMVEDWNALEDSMQELETQAVTQREEKLSLGQIPADYPLPYFTWDELRDDLTDRHPLHLAGGGSHEIDSLFAGDPLALGQHFVPSHRYGGQLKEFLAGLRTERTAGHTSIVISNQAQRLAELWNDSATGNLINPVSRIVEVPPAITFVEGALAEGWTFKADEESAVHLCTDAEIFGWKRPEPRRHSTPRSTSPEAYFADIADGDFVVHVEYGIGRFTGMNKRILDGNEREYLVIQFAGSDMLYVPIHQADRLTRYVGVEGQDPTLSKLGSNEWNRQKEAARAAAEEVARDLLELYAKRASVHGYAFAPDVAWQAELEASFPFIETEDQVRVLKDVKADMERAVPMDRLICGDVGYGKTEIALRAAFKAVMNGKQVAILVPTTVLAQQHYNTFSQRMAAFPVKVEMLSRFRSPKEQKDILDLAAIGGVDILIGTHRLLQDDVKFRDLGLLVIDEEQRFGVTHKEKLKRMRTEVDVLTMTATPIPRTLYMSLAGVRDVSRLTTPPEERLPVLTHVGPHDDKLIRQAILRELDRDGQVYFVHNRVSTIDSIELKLQELVPEANIVIGHGQMAEDELERVMTDFASGSHDVLLCTTIIESGLDIPNANTIIIDNADMFGLAQLYQLRGRVGRSANRGYAYLFYNKHTHLNPDARARLDTIAEQTELGAGMNIAMRDLEIRGTGDLLGLRQSGYIASVGFNLYTQMLAQAVNKLKSGQKIETDDVKRSTLPVAASVTIDLPVPAFIPMDFVPDMQMRLQLYRRIADLTTTEAVDEITSELEDRFGKLPPELLGLLFQVRVKLMALAANATGVTFNTEQIAIKLPYLSEVDRGGLQRYLGRNTRVSRTAVWLPREDGEDWQTPLLKVLERLDMREMADTK